MPVLSPTLTLPVAKYDFPWDGRLARARLLDYCKKKVQATPTGKEIDSACAKRGFLLQREDEPDYTREAWDLPYADVIDGTVMIIPRGVKALASGHGVQAIQDVSDSDKARMRQYVCKLYDRVRQKHHMMPPCPFEKGTKVVGPIEASLLTQEYSRTAAGVPVIKTKTPVNPPIDWFAPIVTIGPTPLTITADGQVYGHGALWDSCHAGYSDRCVPVPRSNQDYKYFHRGAVATEDGTLVAVGHLTVGNGHAGPNGDLQAASEHYDDATTTVAVVAAHEDRWGILLAGALVPEATAEQVAMLQRSPLSGDWRAFEGNLELVAMHGVNVPGFGVDRPRQAIAASGTLIFPGPAVEEVNQEEVDNRIALAASILDGGLDRRIDSAMEILTQEGE